MIKTLASLVLVGGLVIGGQMPDYTEGIVGMAPIDENTMVVHSHDQDGKCKYNTIYVCRETKAWAIYDVQKDKLYIDNDRNGTIDNIIDEPRMSIKSLQPLCK